MSNQTGNDGTYTKGFVIGAIIGAAVGSITALLLAPKSGRELRNDLAQKSTEYYDKTTDYLSDVTAKVGTTISQTVNEGKIKAESLISSAKRQAGEILANAEHVLEGAKSKAFSTKDSVQTKIDSFKEAAKAGAEAFKAEYKNDEA